MGIFVHILSGRIYMDIFEYLPQLIVAYDGNDEFANLIHVKKADKDSDYFCPCCGGTVKPRALDSIKEQSHYYHVTGKCTKESQLHFICKSWLFEKGSKFYIDDQLFEVESIDMEKSYDTPFGKYVPDVTVHTTIGKDIFFEMFFTNRKTGDDYFCKWDYLKNDVVEVNIKEYMFKTDENTIPSFTYLFHDGVCYSKPYVKRDLYANTIAKIKRELTRQKVLNYKARIEQLDWFWQKIRNNETKESILEVISEMNYEDMVSCYEIIKRKQCVLYLKNDVLDMINQKVISEVRDSLDLPYDENIYFDLKHIRGRTYEAGIRLNLKTDHIIYNDFYLCCSEYDFDKLSGYPKIVFSKNVHSFDEINISEEVEYLKHEFKETKKYKEKLIEYENVLSDFEGNDYKIRLKNNHYTVLAKIHDNNFEILLKDYFIKGLEINNLSKAIQNEMKKIKNKEHVNIIFEDKKYLSMISELKTYKGIGCEIDIGIKKGYDCTENDIYFKMYFHNKVLYDKILEPTFEDFNAKINDCKEIIDDFSRNYSFILNLIEKINSCKNDFWKADLLFNSNGYPEIKIDQKLFEVRKIYLLTYEKAYLHDLEKLDECKIISLIKNAMVKVIHNMERCGYRVMEVRDDK